nr:MAG TPA: hypothetical protein [Caudoviricetes sp.]
MYVAISLFHLHHYTTVLYYLISVISKNFLYLAG